MEPFYENYGPDSVLCGARPVFLRLSADVNQYAITWGAPRLRAALVAKYRSWYGMEVDLDREITVTCGCDRGHGLRATRDLVDPDEDR